MKRVMSVKRTIIVILVGFMLLIAYLVLRPQIDVYRSRRVLSSSGTYCMLRVSGESGGYIAYCITKSFDTWNRNLYITDTWFSGRWETFGCWSTLNDDFFVYSRDSGIFYYKNNDSYWREYALKYTFDSNGDGVDDSCVMYANDDSGEEIIYDLVDIPPEILGRQEYKGQSS